MRPSQLLLYYHDWLACEKPDTPEFREWLAAWELHGISSNLMDDDERRYFRYGHYVGWFAAREPSEFVHMHKT